MNSGPHPNGISNRDDNAFQLFQNYMHYCSDEQVTLNNILHTQNLLSNNRYNMFFLRCFLFLMTIINNPKGQPRNAFPSCT